MQAVANALLSVQLASNTNSRILSARGVAGVWQRLLTFAQSICGAAICAEIAAEPILIAGDSDGPAVAGEAAGGNSRGTGEAGHTDRDEVPWLAGTDPCTAPSEWTPRAGTTSDTGRAALVRTCLAGLRAAVLASLERSREAEHEMALHADASVPDRRPKIVAAQTDYELGPGLLVSLSVAPPRVHLLSLSDEMRELAALASGEARLHPTESTSDLQRLIDAAPFLRRHVNLQTAVRGNGLFAHVGAIAQAI